MRALWLLLFCAVACSVACGGESGIASVEGEPEGGGEEAPAPWVQVRRPASESTLEFSARVIAAPEASAEVGAPARARVVGIPARPGQHVEKGDAILEVVMPDVLEATASYLGASDRLRVHRERQTELEALLAQSLVDRSRVFEQRAIVSELEADRARSLAVLQSAGVSAASARSMLAEGKISLRAPIAGIITALDAHLGEVREPASEPFARLAADALSTIEIRSPEAPPNGATATFEAQDGRRFPLHTPASTTAIDPTDGTHLAWFVTDPPAPLPHGLRGRIRFSFSDAWEIPPTSILKDHARAHVIRRGPSRDENVEVEILAVLGDRAIVRAALTDADSVATHPSRVDPASPASR